jgi:Domain of unknown function (DUF4440)
VVRRTRVLGRGVLLLLIVSGCGAWSARREVWRGNQALYDGFRARDVNRLRELLASDFRYLGADGKALDRDTFLAAVPTAPGTTESIVGERLRMETRGDRITVCGMQRAVVRVEGQEQIDVAAYCDDWQERDGRWRVVQAYVPAL